MSQQNYILEEKENALYIYYNTINNIKLQHRLFRFVKEQIIMPVLGLFIIYFYIITWMNMYKDILLEEDTISNTALIIFSIFTILIGGIILFTGFKILLIFGKLLRELYSKQFYSKKQCIVQRGSFVRKNLHPKTQNKKVLEIKSEEVQDIKLVAPKYHERFAQIQISTINKTYKVDLPFDGNVEEGQKLVDKIKAYLY